MILCDVGVLLNAMMAQAPHHAVCRRELDRLLTTPAEMALSEIILAAVVRIATNRRVFQPRLAADQAFAFVDALRSPPAASRVVPGPRHWTLFRDLVLGGGIQGPDVSDAYFAALAMEHGCEWWTTDRGFSRFPGLRWRNLLA